MISIIIPTRNEEKIIEKTLLGFTSKMTLPYEIIVSDGKSIDKTVEIASKYTKNIITCTTDATQTIAGGRDAGARIARGEYLVFFDADCSLPNPDEFFTHALAHFEKDPNLVALIPKQRILPENERFADRFWFGYINLYFRFMNNVLGIGQAGGELQMMRKEAFQKVNGFKADLVAAEDMNMFYRLSQIGRTYIDPDLTVFHTGRRIRKEGWPKLLGEWFMNTLYVFFFKRAKSKEWVPVR